MVVAAFGSYWVILGLLLFLDLGLSVSRASFFSLGMVSRKRLLKQTPLVGEWFLREGLQEGSLRIRMGLQIAQQFLLVSVAFVFYSALSTIGMRFSLWIAFIGTLAIAILLEQGAGRALATRNPEKAFQLTAPLLFSTCILLEPLAAAVRSWVRRLPQTRSAGNRGRDEEVAEEEIQAYIDAGEREGILEKGEGRLLQSIVEFGGTLVREVMTPRTEMVTIEKSTTLKELRQLVAREMHSRIPVYGGNIDQIEGIIHIKDLLRKWDELRDQDRVGVLMRPASFVPETKKVSDLLKDFQKERVHLSIVVDEYGGTAGLVTIEDLLEEIVGEIRDEHERLEEPVVREANGVYLVRGTATVDVISSLFHISLNGEDFDTVGGMIFSILGRVPPCGEMVEHRGLRMEIVEADRRRIHRVRISRAPDRVPVDPGLS